MAGHDRDTRLLWVAMRLSLGVGILMFAGKCLAYVLTDSAAILSDAAESVVHVAAVAFAAFSLRFSLQPPDLEHPYGHEKVSFFSAGFEGAMIGVAALYIVYESVRKLVLGPTLENIDIGALLIAIATVINGLLGWFLIHTGKRKNSLILVANGKHVLTDSITSLGVIVALGLVMITGWLYFDPLLAIVVALNILRSGYGLMRAAVHGLMDRRDPTVDRRLREILDAWSSASGGSYHGLRHRTGGNVLWVDVHLLLDGATDLAAAHRHATEVESRLDLGLPEFRVEVTSHVEPVEEHERHHPSGGYQHH